MTPAEIRDALAAPFDPREVRFKPQIVKNNKALAIAYVDVRVVEDRLDDVLGVENWQDEYQVTPDGVVCQLRVKIGGEWVVKSDVGSPSEQPDGGDRLKAAFSDALKRTAIKLGIGRYLYRVPQQWVDYDPVKKQITNPPRLPDQFLPAAMRGGRTAQSPGPAGGTRANPPSPPPPPASPPPAKPALPQTGPELLVRLQEYEQKLVAARRCSTGQLLAHVTQVGAKAGFTAKVADWTGPAIVLAVEAVKAFETAHPAAG